MIFKIANNVWTVVASILAGYLVGRLVPALVPWLSQVTDIYFLFCRVLSLPFLIVAIVGGLARVSVDPESRRRLTVFAGFGAALMIVAAGIGVFSATLSGRLAATSTADRVEMGRMLLASGPSGGQVLETTLSGRGDSTASDTALKVIQSLVPDNVFSALVDGNAAKICVFGILFGAALAASTTRSHVAIAGVMDGLQAAFLWLFRILTLMVPIVLCAIVAGTVRHTDPALLLLLRGFVIAQVIAGVTIAVLSGALIRFATGRSLLDLIAGMKGPVLAVISTKSFAASLPAMIDYIAPNDADAARISSILLPVGTILSRFGVVAFFAVAVTFIMQQYDLPMTADEGVAVAACAILACLATTGTGGALMITTGLALMSSFLKIPTDAFLVFIIALEPITDVVRLPMTVLGNCAVTSFVLGNRSVPQAGILAGHAD